MTIGVVESNGESPADNERDRCVSRRISFTQEILSAEALRENT